MKIISKILLTGLAVWMSAFSAFALDLPIKKVKGVEYYYYKTHKGESIYGLAKKLGLSREDIVRHNPSAADGLKKNMMLFFPVEEYAEHVMPPEDADTIVTEETVVPAIIKKPMIAVMLPFGLKDKNADKQSKLILDFYKGFLIAADSLSNRSGIDVEIYALDIPTNPASLKTMMENDTVLQKASVIVGPEDISLLNTINSVAREQETYVLNVMNFRDTAYLHDRYSLLGNIPQKEMYEQAVKGLRLHYADYQPVILKSLTGNNDKEAFVTYLTEQYRADGIEPVVIEYQNNLLNADLERLTTETGEKYVVIPSSGTLAEFNKCAHVLRAFRDRLSMIENDDPTAEQADMVVFGYPDWTAFRGDAQDLLHKLEATLYSRFFDDFMGFSARTISADFKYWYGNAMTESLPTYGLLGFDTGTYLIKNLRSNSGKFSPEYPAEFQGVQSTFRFLAVPEGGYYNSALYLVRYLPDGKMSAIVI